MKVFACFQPKGEFLEKIKKILKKDNLKAIYFELNEECFKMPKDTFFIFNTGTGKRPKTSFFRFLSIETRYGIKNNIFIIELELSGKGKISKKEEEEFFQKWKTDWRKFKTKK